MSILCLDVIYVKIIDIYYKIIILSIIYIYLKNFYIYLVNYNFLESNFSVGISISNLSNYYQNKQRNKIELERLKFQLEEKKENDLFKEPEEFVDPKPKDNKDLLKEIELLKAENAYLKKLRALVQERIARESKKGLPPSKN